MQYKISCTWDILTASKNIFKSIVNIAIMSSISDIITNIIANLFLIPAGASLKSFRGSNNKLV